MEKEEGTREPQSTSFDGGRTVNTQTLKSRAHSPHLPSHISPPLTSPNLHSLTSTIPNSSMSSSKPLPTQSSNPQNLPTPSPSPSAPSSHQYPHRPPSHSQKQEDDDNRVRSQRLSRQHHQQDQRIIPSLRYPSNRKTIYDRNLNRTRTAELSRSSFAYLFSEIISYAQQNVKGVQDLERRYVVYYSLPRPPPPSRKKGPNI